jgi:dTDP-4-amino-4,6-dideoxygalactose transaminase
MSVPFLPYAKQSVREADVQAVADALKSETITRGKKVEAFEQAIARYCGAEYAVAFNNGTSALMAAYFAANLSLHDRVISSPNSFIASVGAPMGMGNYPHFIDIDRTTGQFDLQQLKAALQFTSSRGKAIVVPVHFAGIAADMQAIDQLLRPHAESIVIEDAAHALGSSYYPQGPKVGSCAWSQMTIFSFHPAKTITTGEGGMVTTNDPHLCHRLKLFRNNGIEKDAPYLEKKQELGYYEVQFITGNFNFTEFQAAFGLSQLRRLDKFIEKRKRLVKHYRSLLQDVKGIRLFSDQFDSHTAFHLFVVQIDFEYFGLQREVVMKKLQSAGIGSQVHYIPLYRHPIFCRQKGDVSEYFPEMEAYYAQALSLPLYFDLNESDVERICRQLKDILIIKKS